MHVGAEALLTQYWRISTDVWKAGVTWKPLTRTTVSFDEFITHYKGNTIGSSPGSITCSPTAHRSALELISLPSGTVPALRRSTGNGTVNPTCNGFLSYTRSAPTRTLFPSEQFHFESALIPHFTMNGRVIYMGTTSHLTNFNESFNGLDSRAKNRVEDMTGSASARRINVNADYGITWQIDSHRRPSTTPSISGISVNPRPTSLPIQTTPEPRCSSRPAL